MSSVLIVLLLTTCACARKPPEGSTEIEILPPPPYEPLPEGVRPRFGPMVFPPEVLKRDPPVYPESVVAEEVSCTARLLYHIQQDGLVTLVRLEWDDPPPADHQELFEESIRTAILEWRFLPAVKIVATELDDGSLDLERQPVPKAERAIVRFRVEGGRGIVE